MLTRLLWHFLRPYRRVVAVVVGLLVAQTVANLYLPNLNADIINRGVVAGNLHYILRTGAIMLGLSIGVGLVAVVAVYFTSRVSMGAGADLRAAVFKAVQAFSARDVDRFGTASLITRNTNDVQQIQLLLQMALSVMVIAPIMCVGGIIFAVREGAALSPLLGVAVPVMVGFITIVLVMVVPKFRTMQAKLDRINQVLREQITGVRVVRAFVRNEPEAERFAEANEDLTRTALSVNRVFALTMPAILVILNLSSVAVLWFGGRLVSDGSMPIGNLTAFLTYILQILMSVMMAVMVAILLPRAQASAERIEEVLQATPSITAPGGGPARAPAAGLARAPRTGQGGRTAQVSGLVEFDDVSFGYPGSERPVLKGVSFTMRPGETTAVIGGTGSGKTTVLNLVPRFFDVSAGAVRVNGVDVRELDLEELWAAIGLVPQTAYLFSGTVGSNLRLAREDADDAALWRALEISQASDFVSAMPGGLDAPIDQGGTNVSGGQRQRLAIARALVKAPPIYLFDDCFSALDAATDSRLRAALPAATRDASVLIVAQRVSTILHADQIVVLDEGEIVGLGTHQALLGSCAAYREIVVSQLGEEAAA